MEMATPSPRNGDAPDDGDKEIKHEPADGTLPSKISTNPDDTPNSSNPHSPHNHNIAQKDLPRLSAAEWKVIQALRDGNQHTLEGYLREIKMLQRDLRDFKERYASLKQKHNVAMRIINEL